MSEYTMPKEELIKRVSEVMDAIKGLQSYLDTIPDGYGKMSSTNTNSQTVTETEKDK